MAPEPVPERPEDQLYHLQERFEDTDVTVEIGTHRNSIRVEIPREQTVMNDIGLLSYLYNEGFAVSSFATTPRSTVLWIDPLDYLES